MVEDEGPRELHVRSPLARDRDFAGLHWASTKFDWPVTPELTPTRGGGGVSKFTPHPIPLGNAKRIQKGELLFTPTTRLPGASTSPLSFPCVREGDKIPDGFRHDRQ